MALVGQYEDHFGILHEQAYARIVELHINKPAKFVNFVVAIYHNQETRLADKLPVETKYYEVYGEKYQQYFDISVLDEQGSNVYKQAYEYLKNESEEFAGWQDA